MPSSNVITNPTDRVPLPSPDPAMVRHIYSLQGLAVPDLAINQLGVPSPVLPAAKAAPESAEEKIGRLFRERGYPKGTALQPNCWSPDDIAAKEAIAAEVANEYKAPTGTETEVVTATPPPDNEERARSQLRIAIEGLTIAEQAVKDATEVVDRTRNRLNQMELELADYSDLDNQTTEHTARNMRTGEDAELPFALERALAARTNLRDRMDQYGKALVRLQTELREYQGTAVQARQAASQAAIAVLNVKVVTIATEIKEAEAMAKQLRTELWSYARLWVPGTTGPKAVHLSPRIVQLLHTPPEPVNDSDAIMTAEWKALHEALMQSADTEL